ncbi:PCI-domain-containing protein [Phlegmacium glaucopus]|nr:PCI-domain-containing protein [Phlegmacium glaucopus]
MVNTADSVSIFAEGTFEEQILELVAYIVRNRSEDERNTFVAPFQNALKSAEGKKPIEEDENRRKLIISKVLADVKGLGEGSDKEVEGFFNLLFAHLFALYSPSSPELKQYITSLLKVLSSPSSASDRISIRYRILSNLFNTLPRTSPLRLLVYQSLLATANAHDDIDVLELTKADVEKWISEWDISADEKAAFLKSIVDAHAKADRLTTSYEYSLLYVQSLPPSSQAGQSAAVEAIAVALRLDTIFNFDPLFKLDTVLAVKSHELFSLLLIFLNNGLPEYQAWEKGHPGTLEKYQIAPEQLERKIRLLTLSSLAFKYIGQNLPYSKVAEALQVDISEVEKWAIDVIRAGLVWGKLSQTTQSLQVTRSTSRTFEREQWQALEKRLVAWKAGLENVLDVVASAKRQSGQAVA